MSTKAAPLAVPAENRAQYLARVELVRQRARASQASSTELDLALAVLHALYAAPSARVSA